jgi:FkbM family methyltransferase
MPFALNLSDPLSRWRAESFWTKERETLRWLEFFSESFSEVESTLIDVGANIGIYSLYWLSLSSNVQVIACEPFESNVELLRTNLSQNDWLSRAKIIDTPLYSDSLVGHPSISDTRAGGSGYKFEELKEGDLKPKGFISSSTVDLVASGIQGPMIVKIDVDGLDYEVLVGAKDSLESGQVRSVLIEATDEIHPQISSFLGDFGFIEDDLFNLLPGHSTIRRLETGVKERNKVYTVKELNNRIYV